MTLVLVAYGTQLLNALLFLLGTYASCRALGIAMQRVQLGTGPAAWKRPFGSVTLAVGAIPLGSFVQFVRDAPETEPSDGEGEPEPPPDAFDRASRVARILVTLAGLSVMAIAPLVLLGPSEAWRSISEGVPQIVRGTIAPLSTGRALVAATAQLPPLQMAGVLAAKIIAWNLLPLPTTSLWTVLRVVLGGAWSRSCVANVVPMLIGVSWLVAIGAWMFE